MFGRKQKQLDRIEKVLARVVDALDFIGEELQRLKPSSDSLALGAMDRIVGAYNCSSAAMMDTARLATTIRIAASDPSSARGLVGQNITPNGSQQTPIPQAATPEPQMDDATLDNLLGASPFDREESR